MLSARIIQTGRLTLSPVAWGDLQDLQRLKCDPLVFGQMLGGVRSPSQVTAELAEDSAFWARNGSGIWMVRDSKTGACYGLTGLHERPDGRGVGLRFAFTPESRGHGYAREAAGAALRHAHESAGIERVVAVAKESNFSSRMVLGAIGMREFGHFERSGDRMLMFESVRPVANPARFR